MIGQYTYPNPFPNGVFGWGQGQAPPGANGQQGSGGQQQGQSGAGGQGQPQPGTGAGNPAGQLGSGGTPAQPGTLNPGAQNPYATDAYPIQGPPGRPGEAFTQNFLPSIFRDPYLQGISAATNSANWAAQAIPGASQFHQQLYNPGLNQFEQMSLAAQAQLAGDALGQTQAKLAGMFENAPSGGLAPAMLQAANQSSAQLGQSAANMALQRQQLATQSLPFTFGFPIQATQASQQASQGLMGAAQAAMYGDSSFPLAALGSNPFSAPTVIAQQPSSGGKGK